MNRFKLIMHRLKPKTTKVRCFDCGFLAFGDGEVVKSDRILLAARGQAGCPDISTLHCFRSCWTDYDLSYSGNPDGPKFDEVNQQRHCNAFRLYEPGVSPQEHLQRLKEDADRNAQFWNSLKSSSFVAILSGLISGLVVVGAQWVLRHLG